MSAEKAVTEREAVLRERRAYVAGAVGYGGQSWRDAAEESATARFALPKVVRPRVVTDAYGLRWRVLGERFEYTWGGNPPVWIDALSARAGNPGMTPERIRFLYDLLARPTEEVDDA